MTSPGTESASSPILLKSPLLEKAGFVHGFFTRHGGVSEGVFNSLNFTTVTGDSEENVDRNLEVAGKHLGVDAKKIYFLSQVHGVQHLDVDGTEDRKQVVLQEGDTVITDSPEAAAAIRTADCVSILFASPKTGTVAACHSGWQGCEKNIAAVTAKLLQERGITDLLCAIGPHISAESFEVDQDVADRLVAASPEKDIVDTSHDKPHVDLRKMVRSQLESCGIAPENIDDVEGCTVVQKDLYYSFRRDGNPSGRMLTAIVGKSV